MVYLGDKMAELYDRQRALDLNIPEKVLIVGAGGIGSWVVMSMGLIGVPNIYIADFDVIEEHNLNRTLFRQMDIGEYKTSALAELLMDRREDIYIRFFNKRLEELDEMELREVKDALIIDCRDVFAELPEELQNKRHVKLSYDGLSVTIILNPNYDTVWDLEPEAGYQVIPSFLAPCQYLASAITTIVTNPGFNIEEKENVTKTLNLKEHFENLMGE